jgi:hypothetical protein
MTLFREIGEELLGMFVADGWLAASVLAVVALVAGLVLGLGTGPVIAGCTLLFGCLAALVAAAWHAGRREVQR